MIEVSKVQVTEEHAVTKKCDKCGGKVSIYSSSIADKVEWQEFLHIRFTAGYGSQFGDMNVIACDLCMNCAEEILKPYYKIIDPNLSTLFMSHTHSID